MFGQPNFPITLVIIIVSCYHPCWPSHSRALATVRPRGVGCAMCVDPLWSDRLYVPALRLAAPVGLPSSAAVVSRIGQGPAHLGGACSDGFLAHRNQRYFCVDVPTECPCILRASRHVPLYPPIHKRSKFLSIMSTTGKDIMASF